MSGFNSIWRQIKAYLTEVQMQLWKRFLSLMHKKFSIKWNLEFKHKSGRDKKNIVERKEAWTMWSDPQFINTNYKPPNSTEGIHNFIHFPYKENSFSISEYDANVPPEKGWRVFFTTLPIIPLPSRTTRSIVLGIKSTTQKELYIYVFLGTEISIGMYFEVL